MDTRTRKKIGLWLLIGLFLVLGQVILGGITRLTDSGLSITEWDIVKGTLPPLSEKAWQTSFEKYQTFAKTQYESLHSNMTLPEFKQIFFWEWFHRFWGRMMGLIFLIPFLYFLYKKYLPKWLINRLLLVVGIAALAATFGIIMVFSGLENENRTWVSAYKLAAHLSIALVLFATLFKTLLLVWQPKPTDFNLIQFKKYSKMMLVLVFVQVIFGALMAGMRAGSIHTAWPFFLGGNTLAKVLQSATSLSFLDFINYENNNYIKAIVQILHRSFAWIVFFATLFTVFKLKKQNISSALHKGLNITLFLVCFQFLLGVITIINYTNMSYRLPMGVLHQSFAFITFISWVFVHYQFSENKLEQ